MQNHNVSIQKALPWWANPAKFVMFITLPVFIWSSLYAQEIADSYNFYNFVSAEIIFLGMGCLLLIAFGVKLGEAILAKKVPHTQFNETRYISTIHFLASISIIAHIILIGKILVNYHLVFAALSGSIGAIYEVKRNMTKVEGVTTFTQMYLIVLPLCAAYSHLFAKALPRYTKMIAVSLFVLVFIRAFVTLERLAIVEAVVAYAIVFISYRTKPVPFVNFFPIFGAVVIYLLFAAGEYTRSWPYYRDVYASFWDFVNIRLLGYVGIATNNGAGVLELTGPVNYPYFTAGWFRKLPIWETSHGPLGYNPLDVVFDRFGSAEFNNPGGILGGVLDFGYLSILYYLVLGLVSGLLFALFKKRSVYGLVYFPGWFLGFPVLTQALFWGDPRFFTVTVFAPFVAMFIAKKNKRIL